MIKQLKREYYDSAKKERSEFNLLNCLLAGVKNIN